MFVRLFLKYGSTCRFVCAFTIYFLKIYLSLELYVQITKHFRCYVSLVEIFKAESHVNRYR